MLVDLSKPMTQQEFADLVGISQPAVSDLLARNVIQAGESGLRWLHGYCSSLRDSAAGRSNELVEQRARLAREQADGHALKNMVARRELAPVIVLERALASLARQIAGVLEAIPVNLKRRLPHLTADDLVLVEQEITRLRNMAAEAELDLGELNNGGEDDDLQMASPESDGGDSEGFETA